MTSKAMLNTTATIAIAQGIAEMILERYGMCIGLDQYKSVDAVNSAATAAYRHWPGDISGKGSKRLLRMINQFELYVRDSEQSITAFISTGIALLERLADRLTDPRRKRAIVTLIRAMSDFYRDYDPDYEFEDGYVAAALLENRWAKIVEEAA